MWRCIDHAMPTKVGLYDCRMVNGAERQAFWTGKSWGSKASSRQRWPEAVFVRYWRER